MPGKKLKLTSVNGKKVKSPKGTKTVTTGSGGRLVYLDKDGNRLRRRNTPAPPPKKKRG